MAYRGKFTPKNPDKYLGNIQNITYRSLWERNAFRWIDANPDIVGWVSEEIVIPYICATDKKRHRYFVDIYFETKEGKRYLIEIKPDKETRPPKIPKKRTRRYISEALTYAKNQSKWEAADSFAKDNGLIFQVWTENHLKALGIRIL
jgi:hypothetical protein